MTPITNFNVKKYLIIIVLCAVAARLLFVILADPIPQPQNINLDDVDFNYLGYKVSIGAGLTDKYGDPTTTRFPLYPVFLGIIYFFFGWNTQAAFIIQALIGALTPILVYLISREFFERKISLLAAAIAAFYPSYIVYSGRVMSENLFLPELACLILLTLKLRKELSWKYVVLTGITVGLLVLTRGTGFPFFFLLPLYALLSGGKAEIRKRILPAAVMMVIAFIVIFPWTLRNYLHFGKFRLTGTSRGVILKISFDYWPTGEMFHIERAYAYVDSVGRDKADLETFHRILVEDNLFGYKGMKAGFPLIYPGLELPDNEAEIDRFMIEDVKQMIAANPKILLLKTIREFLRFWHFLDDRGRYVIGYGLILPFFLAGLWLIRRRLWEFAPLLAFLLYTWGIETLFMSAARFRMPFEVVMIVIGAYALAVFFTRIKPIALPAAVTAIIIAVNVYFNFNVSVLRGALRAAASGVGIPIAKTSEEYVPHLKKDSSPDTLKLDYQIPEDTTQSDSE